MQPTQYNPFKDPGFIVVSVFGLINLLPLAYNVFLFGVLEIMESTFAVTLVLFIVWGAWIFFKKGKKGSFLIGFLIGLVAVLSLIFIISSLNARREEALLMDLQSMELESIQP